MTGGFTNQNLMQDMVEFASKTFKESGALMPMWILVDAEGKQSVYLTPYGNEEEKNITSELIKRMIANHNAVRLGFMSETWMVSAPEGTTESEAKHIVPSEHPNRSEAILFMVEDRDGQNISGMVEISRDKDGKGSLGAYQESGFNRTKGRFANFFSHNETVH